MGGWGCPNSSTPYAFAIDGIPGLWRILRYIYTDMPNPTKIVDANIDDATATQANEQAPVTQSSTTTSSDATAPRDERRDNVDGTLRTESIMTCVEVIPNKGGNAGKLMYVINGKHWSRTKPAETDNVVVLEYFVTDTASGWNVNGFNNDARTLSVDQKIAKLTSYDASYSNAIALLLR